jgi:Flp pilus assembly protein TadG
MINKPKSESGQVLVEFALILPVLLLILAGIAEFGILFYNKQVLNNASREGARAGIVYKLNSSGVKIIPNVQKVVQDYCANRLVTFAASTPPPVTITPALSGLAYPSDLTVTVTMQYTFLMPSVLNMFGGSFGPTLDISGTTIMRME